METPYGQAIDGPYVSKQQFYDAYPAVAVGWGWEKHPHAAPLGDDLKGATRDEEDPNFRENWLLTFCRASDSVPNRSPKGVVTAYKRDTEEIFVVAKDLDWPTARAKWPETVRADEDSVKPKE
ncbi:hypothetical protein [Kocuria rhizophila]|uniref:hypothetical protein n=1 Tax=Kocuria rhizophila TaxID=72000 RepID=UPI00190A8B50|nr:hypothetical protein [Kocuria rhizophila]MBK4120919.1 hypothetical protein [Kocuria rhizophila]